MFIPTLPFGKYKQMAESKRDNKWKQIRRGGGTDGKSSTKYTNHVVMTSSTVITHIALNSKGNIPLKILVQI